MTATHSPEQKIAILAEATARLRGALAAVQPAALGDPSLLPGWTVGHVMAHLARNADAQRNLLHWAATGEPTPMYPSRQARDADIEEGSRRAPAEILADFGASADRLSASMTSLPADRWNATIDTGRGGPTTAQVVLAQRLAEVELHHHDLGIDGGLALLTAATGANLLAAVLQSFVRTRPLDRLVLAPTGGQPVTVGGGERPATVAGPAGSIAGWLAGRTDGADLTCDGPLPDLPVW